MSWNSFIGHQNFSAPCYTGCCTKFVKQSACYAGRVNGNMDFSQSGMLMCWTQHIAMLSLHRMVPNSMLKKLLQFYCVIFWWNMLLNYFVDLFQFPSIWLPFLASAPLSSFYWASLTSHVHWVSPVGGEFRDPDLAKGILCQTHPKIIVTVTPLHWTYLTEHVFF